MLVDFVLEDSGSQLNDLFENVGVREKSEIIHAPGDTGANDIDAFQREIYNYISRFSPYLEKELKFSE